MTRWTLALVALLSTACGVGGGTSGVGGSTEGLSQPGPWQIPGDVLAIGETQDVTYTGAGPWIGIAGCEPSFTPGARVFEAWLLTSFPGVYDVGGYNCRTVRGDDTLMSVHGTGRALDAYVWPIDGAADNDGG